jgi:SAM-dependent methyltransferase
VRRQVPVLINESSSLFSIAGVLAGSERAFPVEQKPLRKILSSLAPSLSSNLVGRQNYEAFARAVLDVNTPARVLVVGSRVAGSGMEVLAERDDIQMVESDVEIGPRPAVVFDAHDIPFEDETFDGVIVQAVLEHVVDPVRCAAEIRRVLRTHGVVYAETPFMQQVHEGAYDFTRFTHLGHRRLWRDFEELASGVACGPGMALGWAWRYFLLSFARRPATRTIASAVARSTGFWLKYFDRFLANHPGAYDAASGFYFLGRRSQTRLADRQLPHLYRGGMR